MEKTFLLGLVQPHCGIERRDVGKGERSSFSKDSRIGGEVKERLGEEAKKIQREALGYDIVK